MSMIDEFKRLKGYHMGQIPSDTPFSVAYEKAEELALRDTLRLHTKEIFARQKQKRKASRPFVREPESNGHALTL